MHTFRPHPRNRSQHGVTLIEVLITVLVIAIGLLGMASLQLNGLRANHDAYYRTQASIFAADLSDRIRANLTGARAGDYVLASTPQDPGFDCETTFPSGDSCTPAELASADLFMWHDAVTDADSGLPLATATVACAACTIGSAYTITLAWDEDRDGVLSGLPNDPVYTVQFVP